MFDREILKWKIKFAVGSVNINVHPFRLQVISDLFQQLEFLEFEVAPSGFVKPIPIAEDDGTLSTAADCNAYAFLVDHESEVVSVVCADDNHILFFTLVRVNRFDCHGTSSCVTAGKLRNAA